MRGHPLASTAPCAFIPYPGRLSPLACLPGSLPVSLLVPWCMSSCLRPAPRIVERAARLRLPSSPIAPPLLPLPLACFPRFLAIMALASYRLPPRSSPRFDPSPRRSCRKTGRRHLDYRHAGRLCLLGVRCRSYLKTLLGNFLKPFLGNFLKIFSGNLLEMVKHIHLSICPVPPFCDCVAASPPIVSLFILSRL